MRPTERLADTPPIDLRSPLLVGDLMREFQLQRQFEKRAAKWLEATEFISSTTAATSHRTYIRIIALGEAVVPLLIEDLQRDPNTNWYTALVILTDENPVTPALAGNYPAMAAAWKTWLDKGR